MGGRDTKTKRWAERKAYEKDSQLSTELDSLTDAEVQQLQNIDSNIISGDTWTLLAEQISTLSSTEVQWLIDAVATISSGTDLVNKASNETITGNWTFAPITISSGLLDPETGGAFEYYGNKFYITNVGKRRAIDRTSDVAGATTSVSNTNDETTIYSASFNANTMISGNLIKIHVNGILSNATAADDLTIATYIGGTQVSIYNPAIGNVTNADWHMEEEFTVRSVGATGSIAVHGHTDIDGNETYFNSIETIDTTVGESLSVTITWDNAKAGNVISLYQGYMEIKN